MNRVMKKGAPLAVMTFVTKRFFRFRRIREHLERDHGVHVFDVEELNDLLTRTGFGEFDHKVYGSIILFSGEKS